MLGGGFEFWATGPFGSLGQCGSGPALPELV